MDECVCLLIDSIMDSIDRRVDSCTRPIRIAPYPIDRSTDPRTHSCHAFTHRHPRRRASTRLTPTPASALANFQTPSPPLSAAAAAAHTHTHTHVHPTASTLHLPPPAEHSTCLSRWGDRRCGQSCCRLPRRLRAGSPRSREQPTGQPTLTTAGLVQTHTYHPTNTHTQR